RRCEMMLSTSIRRFDIQLQADGKSEHTRAAYLRDLHRFRTWLRKDTGIAAIKPKTLAKFCASGSCSNRRAISINHTKATLRVFFKFLMDAGHIRSNPARLIKNGRCQPKVPDHFTAAEARRFLCAIPAKDEPVSKRDRTMFTLLLQTGIRLGSMINLKVSDVDLGQRSMTIRAKGNTAQTIYLNSTLRKVLRSYIRATGLVPTDPLFPSRNGNHLSRRQVQLRFKHWLDKAGIERNLTVHSLRHYAESRIMPSR
ncbi:MAG: tyrosine-type recombinase/integrase, partial [Candidatus Eisenbacteria bacterium]